MTQRSFVIVVLDCPKENHPVKIHDCRWCDYHEPIVHNLFDCTYQSSVTRTNKDE